jgi:hypothetical protein
MILSLVVSVAIALASSGSTVQPQKSPAGPTPDEKAIHDYVLTVDKVEKYASFMKRIQTGGADPAVAAEMQKIRDMNVYNVEKADMMAKSPKLASLFTGSGITPRDFVLLPLTIMSAAVVAQYPEQGATKMAYVTPQQVQFYKDHKADLEKWGLQ